MKSSKFAFVVALAGLVVAVAPVSSAGIFHSPTPHQARLDGTSPTPDPIPMRLDGTSPMPPPIPMRLDGTSPMPPPIPMK
ncbi:MAG TPA: hypothetical protein VJR23_09490 [Candidatus Acidoferrales bacterium]|nr:hypothetical protein [Candidatus Acidoferrales bacterium]